MKFIFEDNYNSAISKLLLKCMNSDNLLFAGDNGRIIDILVQYYNENDTFIIFLDYNCRATLYRQYTNLKFKIKEYFDYTGNIYIRLIPCIEYIVLEMLYLYKYTVDTRVYDVLKFNRNALSQIKGSGIENKLKKFLNSLGSCYYNYNVSLSTRQLPYGEFYLSDDNSINLKAEQLYTQLPVFDVYFNKDYINLLYKHNISFKQTTWNQINDDMIKFFNDMANSLNRTERYTLSIFI